MSLRRYFKPANKLPTADKAGLSANVVKEVNQVVTRTLEQSEASAGKKGKYTTTFTPEDRAAIARYAAQNGNSAAVKKFKAYHNVGESTVRSFKKIYLEELKKQPNPGNEAEEVTSLPLIFAIARRQTQRFNTQLASKPRNANIKLRN